MSDRISILEEGLISTTIPRLQITSKTYRWKTLSTWNTLPRYIREETEIASFKKKHQELVEGEKAARSGQLTASRSRLMKNY